MNNYVRGILLFGAILLGVSAVQCSGFVVYAIVWAYSTAGDAPTPTVMLVLGLSSLALFVIGLFALIVGANLV